MNDKPTFQTKLRDNVRTGDEEKDFRNGCIAIHATVVRAIADCGVTASVNVSWGSGQLCPLPATMTFTASANGKHEHLVATQEQVMDSYERADDPTLMHAIRQLAHELTK